MSVFKCNLLMIYFFRSTVKTSEKFKNFLTVFFFLAKGTDVLFASWNGGVELE